jgi:hypothetical protein
VQRRILYDPVNGLLRIRPPQWLAGDSVVEDAPD